jgi:hypothetical protein
VRNPVHSASVRLAATRLRYASYVGVDRFVGAVERHRKTMFGDDRIGAHVLGAWGEAVIAQATGLYWPNDDCQPDRHEPDVGPWHVRTTARANFGLALHNTDPDDEPFVLVVAKPGPLFDIVGWCLARDGKRNDYWRTDIPYPAYVVPRDALKPFDGYLTV